MWHKRSSGLQSNLKTTSFHILFVAMLGLLSLISSIGESRAAIDATKIDKSVIRIGNVTNSLTGATKVGTGFFINKNGYAITNNHVISDSDVITGKRITYMFSVINGKLTNKNKIKIIWASKEQDLAIVKVENYSAPPLTLFTGKSAKGEHIYASGYPGAADDWTGQDANFIVSTLTDGIIGRVYTDHWPGHTEKLKLIQHSAQVNHGNSGGPLLNTCNQVVGVNSQSASVMENGSVTGVFFSLHISHVITALKANHITFNSSNSCNPESNTLLKAVLLTVVLAAVMGIFLAGKTPREAIKRDVTKASHKSNTAIPRSHPALLKWCLQMEVNGWPEKRPLELKQLNDAKGLVIGRDANICHFQLADASISGRHCRLKLEQDNLLIEDLNSTNGTIVQGKMLSPFQSVQIHHGDEIRIGNLPVTLVKSRD